METVGSGGEDSVDPGDAFSAEVLSSSAALACPSRYTQEDRQDEVSKKSRNGN